MPISSNAVSGDTATTTVVIERKSSVRSALLSSVSSLALLAASSSVIVGSYNLQNAIDQLVEAAERFDSDVISAQQHVMAASHKPLEAVSGTLASTDNSVTPILDLIGQTEGTDRGDGYNETLAYGRLTGGDVVLIDMTLAEIDDLQTAMLAHPDNRWNSSAVGRYQIVRTTLRALKKKLGLPETAKFTAELQDRLAIELLKGRGFEAWKVGRINDHEFALELSKEWASLPNPQTGKGHYPGQRAAVDFATVQSVLDQVRPKPTLEKTAASLSHRTATLSATKPVDGPVTLAGKLNLASVNDWDITGDAEYQFKTDAYKFGGVVTYGTEDLSISLSGTHNSDENTEFKAEVQYRF